MASYQYIAVDSGGRRRRGLLDADHVRQVRAQLRAKGLTPLSVQAVRSGDGDGAGTFARGIGDAALALATRQLATLLQAAVPLEEALATVARQCEAGRLRRALQVVRGQVAEGRSLADALRRAPARFPPEYVATIAAGEHSGRLDAVLERLADHIEERETLQQKVTAALIYPALLTLTSVAIVVALLTWIVPQVVAVFAESGQSLPWLTRALIATSDGLQAYGLYLALALLGAAGGLRWLLARPGWRMRWHRLQLHVPLWRRLLLGVNTARFTRTLSLLLASGVPVIEAMNTAAEVVRLLPLRAAAGQAAVRVREGAAIARSLERTGYFPPMTVQLIANGEASGRLESMLERAALALEREQSRFTDAFVRILEPLLILVMGAMVMVIVLAILMPVFSLNQMIG